MGKGELGVIIRAMIRYIIGVLILIAASLAVMYFYVGVPRIYQEPPPQAKEVHRYNDPSRSLEEISVLVFYFVPRNRFDSALENWHELLEKNVQKLQAFHTLQLQSVSQLDYTIYPKPVIGLQDNLYYDTDVTRHGNPEALRRVTRELEARVLEASGDLFRSDFLPGGYTPDGQHPYQVLLIMYEGVGASGGDNVALVSSTFLADPRFNTYGASIMTHEFYHTLGIPDGYDLTTSLSTSSDIMGLNRTKPIEKVYLDTKTLNSLGL